MRNRRFVRCQLITMRGDFDTLPYADRVHPNLRTDIEQEDAVTDTDEGAPTFEGDIKPLFRERDHAAMLHVFDLWSFDDVSAHADAILAAVRGGSMPCDARWSQEKVGLFQRWVDSGTPGGETTHPPPG